MHLNSAFDKLSEYRLEKYCENFQEGREEQIAALREEMGPENGDRVRWTVEVWDERCADQ